MRGSKISWKNARESGRIQVNSRESKGFQKNTKKILKNTRESDQILKKSKQIRKNKKEYQKIRGYQSNLERIPENLEEFERIENIFIIANQVRRDCGWVTAPDMRYE